ncbi:MAG: M20/M25/M40 family metallo-hydrolase [Gemmatimonadaceae bacterium]|nr:M20/M25/M40 family metallo-hydrolase [Gemmatimonadaceae bacterium]
MSRPSRLLLLAAALPAALGAQAPLTGYQGTAASAVQRDLERRAIAVPSADSSRRIARVLSREPHVAGTPAQERTRDYVNGELRRLGLRVETRSYRVYLPHATGVQVWRVAPAPMELPVDEPAIGSDPVSALPQYPTVNGYSAAGDVTGEVVYVNYGLVEDYARLDAMGVSVRGKVVIARYGRSFRGIKAREAEQHGATAILIYSDPGDDGYAAGDVYPEGPMRNARGVQRGSVYNGYGDPSTPGYGATVNAPRVPASEMAIPHIPVVPVSYGTAAALLEGIRGTGIQQGSGWQGGLPFRYHVGPGPVQARVRVTLDDAPFKMIHNTIATLPGRASADEVIVIGGHRDAWGAGAGDNVSGITSILESARAVVRALDGRSPARTLVFATWDAEEWGMLGSTEFVEDDSLRLQRGGVAYLNLDVSATGLDFGAGGSPSLRALTRELAREVPDPRGAGSIYAAWRARAGVSDSTEPAMGDPGGGSDFAGFYNHFGIPHADWGFGGPGGVYHSAYDSNRWMEQFGDTGYVAHAAAARLAAAMLLRLANADIVPYDYAEFGRTMRRYTDRTSRLLASIGAGDAAPLDAAWVRFTDRAVAFNRTRDSVLARGGVAPAALRTANAALRQVERRLSRPEGLRSRKWVRGVIYAADVDNGYSTMIFPTIGEAVRAGDAALARSELADLVSRIGTAGAALDEARSALAPTGGR